ncbi:MAG: tetratricopeptide repeat protein [Patescibacteria group bacterium]
MLIINLIAIAIIVLSLAGAAVVVARKFPQLAQLDPAALPEVRSDLVKDRLIRQKFTRVMSERLLAWQQQLRPYQQRVGQGVTALYRRLLELERRAKKKLEPTTPQQRAKVDQRTETLVEVGNRLLVEGKYIEAEQKFINALSLDARDVEAYQGLGELYTQQGNLEQAKETFEYILKINEDDFAAHSRLGNLALAQDKLEEARAHYLRSVELDAAAAVHHYDLGQVYQRQGELSAAHDAFQKAHGLEPRHPRYLDALLEVCILLGKKLEALTVYDQLAAVNPDNQKLPDLKERIAAI